MRAFFASRWLFTLVYTDREPGTGCFDNDVTITNIEQISPWIKRMQIWRYSAEHKKNILEKTALHNTAGRSY